MADLRMTYLEREESSGRLAKVDDEATSRQAAELALVAAEAWIEPDRRNRSYRIDRLLPPD